MSKRLLILAALLVLILAACGQDEATPEPTTAAAVEETAPAEAPPTEAPPTEMPPTEAAAAETTETPADTASRVAEMEHTADPQLVDITWEWVRRDPNGNSSPEIVVPDPAKYTLIFNQDGTFNATLDCNNGAGVYATPTPGRIFMELGPMTMAACPPESLSVEMANTLSGVAQDYRFEENGDVLVLVWAAGGPLDYYRNAGVPEPGEEEVNAIPENAIQLDLNGLATSYDWQVMPGTPLVPGPGAQGFPPYILLTFDGAAPEDVLANNGPRMYIFPTEAYVNLYQAAGSQAVADQVIRLGQLIATADERTALPDSPMPLLPPPNSLMDRWAQFSDLNFGSGEGVRYVSDSPYRQAIGVWTNETTGYYYQGLTTDQTFYVSLFWPVATTALPNTVADATPEQTEAVNSADTYGIYMQETKDTLNLTTAADWTPDLDSLDAMASSLTFPLPGESTAEATPEGGEGTEQPVEGTATAEPEATAEGEESILPEPGVGDATATVTAPDGIFVRSGPGTEYPDIAVAPYESTAKVTGVSEDGRWWVIEVPLSVAADQQGWVSADWVDVSNAGGVPVVEAPSAAEPSLTGVTWQWVSTTTPVEAITVADPANYTIRFNTDGTANIVADCNNVGATYTTDGGAISITLGPSTLAACGDESLDQQYLASLGAAALTFFQEGDLFMDLTADGGTMRFTSGAAAAPAATPEATPEGTPEGTPESPTAAAEGLVFNLVSFGPEGAEQSPIEGTQITAAFTATTVSGGAGCNDYTGQVTPVEDYFTIGGIAATQQVCETPAGVMEQEQAYLAALAGTSGYEWQQDAAGGNLVTGARLLYRLADGTSGFLNYVAQ